jgi:cytidylate kinase
MTVITISRELGSLGTYIARQTAQALACPLMDKLVIERMIDQVKAGVSIAEMMRAEQDLVRWDLNGGEMVYLYDRVIQAAAHRGNLVMLGRGSFAVLARYADVLNVRIQAPFELRVRRVMESEHLTQSREVEVMVKESDRVRSSFIYNWYGLQWENATLFNLTIDTSRITTDLAVSWLSDAYHAMQEMPINDLPCTREIQVDERIQAAVDRVLAKTPIEA